MRNRDTHRDRQRDRQVRQRHTQTEAQMQTDTDKETVLDSGNTWKGKLVAVVSVCELGKPHRVVFCGEQ